MPSARMGHPSGIQFIDSEHEHAVKSTGQPALILPIYWVIEGRS